MTTRHPPTHNDFASRVRVMIAVARPPVMMLLAMYAATGLAAAGGDVGSPLALLPALIAVAGFLVYSVSLNDLADVDIDRINLANRLDRPLVTGAGGRSELVATAAVGAIVALGAALSVGLPALAVCAAGLAVSAAYSLKPMRLSARGAVASLVLPACYVAVPYLIGVLSTSARLDSADLVLLGALYVGFIGRILLKDFRDVRGDALFGKRTFLVRHGRRATCRFAAVGWIGGTALTVFAMSMRGPLAIGLIASYAAALAGVIAMLGALAIDRGPRRDELLVSAIAIVGRGQLLVLLASLSMALRPQALVSPLVAALAIVAAGQTVKMLRRGPVMRHTVPEEWLGRAAATAGPDALEQPTKRSQRGEHADVGGGRRSEVERGVGGRHRQVLKTFAPEDRVRVGS